MGTKSMELQSKILASLRRVPEGYLVRADQFNSHLGTRVQVGQALAALARNQDLYRISPGVYVVSLVSRFGKHPPSPHKVMVSLAFQKGFEFAQPGSHEANNLGLSTQVPAKYAFVTTGRSFRLQLGNWDIQVKHAPLWMFVPGEAIQGMVVRALDWLGEGSIGPYEMKKISDLLFGHDIGPMWNMIEEFPAWIRKVIRNTTERPYLCTD